jgi:glutamate dehydrogenase (NAD(P)+)
VSTASGAVHDPAGLDIGRLRELHAELGDDCVRAYGGKRLDLGAELTLDTDVLVPAATQDVIAAAAAREVNARLVVEGANLPTTPEARATLSARGITVVPDFIANAGGVVAAAYAMDARHSAFRPEPEQVFSSISEKLRSNVVTVLERSRATGVTTHQAALLLAQERVRKAMLLRGRTASTQGGKR